MYYLIFSALYQCLPLLFNLEQCSSNSFMHREGLTVVRLRLLCFCLGCSWQPVLVCGSQEACSSNKQSGDPVWLSVSCVDWGVHCVCPQTTSQAVKLKGLLSLPAILTGQCLGPVPAWGAAPGPSSLPGG
uniref:Uncharacterized protein n=1 Tax=Trichinella nativa TaxID=6335 RepID=A0A0V1KK83_9BILA